MNIGQIALTVSDVAQATMRVANAGTSRSTSDFAARILEVTQDI